MIYEGQPEATNAPEYGWLHHTENTPPLVVVMVRRRRRRCLPNLTGTVYAHRPSGHMLAEGKRKPATGDYEAWKPE